MAPAMKSTQLATTFDPRMLTKEKVLVCLTKLNEKSTQRVAAEELFVMIKELDLDGLSLLVSNLCSTGAEQKPSARKECIRALGILSTEACPVRDAVLQQPLLNKLVNHIRKHMQDVDGSVRDACAEALTQLVRGMASTSGGAAAGSTSNPVIRVICEALAETRKECQTAASVALLQVSPYLAPLDRELVKDVIRLLKSTTFQAMAALLAAIASIDPETREPVGLIKVSGISFAPFVSQLVGQPPGRPGTAASGLLGCLNAKDWAVRKAAADALVAVALILGRDMEPEGCWLRDDPRSVTGRCIRALEEDRFDKVREARDAVRQALTVFEELQRAGSSGTAAPLWEPPPWEPSSDAGAAVAQSVALPAGAAGCSGIGSRPATPPVAPINIPANREPSPPRERKSPIMRDSSMHERFQKAHSQREKPVAEPPPPTYRQQQQQQQQQQQVQPPPAQPQARPVAGGMLLSQRSGSSNGSGVGRSGAQAAEVPSGPSGELMQAGTSADDVIEPDMADGAAAARPVLPLQISDPDQSGDFEDDMCTSQSNVVVEDAPTAAAASAAANAAAKPMILQPTPPPPRNKMSRQPSFTRSPSSARGKQPPSSESGTVVLSVLQWESMRQQMQELSQQQQALAAMMEQLSRSSLAATSALKDEVAALTDQVRQLQQPAAPATATAAAATTFCPVIPAPTPPPARSPRTSFSSPGWALDVPLGAPASVSRPSSPGQRPPSFKLRTSSHTPRVPPSLRNSIDEAITPTPISDINSAYAEALQDGRSDMRLLRVIQKTGPVWAELAPDTALLLLRAFIRYVKDGVMMHRILPWLWRLADESSNCVEVPLDVRQQLLAALAASPTTDDPTADSAAEKVTLLSSTLRSVWGIGSSGGGGGSGGGSGSSGGGPSIRPAGGYAPHSGVSSGRSSASGRLNLSMDGGAGAAAFAQDALLH